MNNALKTDIGLNRDTNQDLIDVVHNQYNDTIYILCDGMGGYKGGEIAASECSKIIKKEFEKAKFKDVLSIKEWLYIVIKKANKAINAIAKKNAELEKMGTTIVCLVISGNHKVYASVGDSRIYSYNHKNLTQLSEDQTFAQALLKAGYINQKEADIHPKKNLLLCAIGSNEDDLDIQIKETNEENYLLCSDGLYNMIDHKELHKIITNNEELDKKAQTLIDVANQNGGKDNISVILVEGCL